jgi:hypothetical protein
MHLVGPFLSTTGKKKGKRKFVSADQKKKLDQLAIMQQKLYKKYGVPEQSSVSKPKFNTLKVTSTKYIRETPVINSLPFTGAPCYKAPDKVYTGTLIKGIATMHKSNAVPIINDQEATDISRMRR